MEGAAGPDLPPRKRTGVSTMPQYETDEPKMLWENDFQSYPTIDGQDRQDRLDDPRVHPVVDDECRRAVDHRAEVDRRVGQGVRAMGSASPADRISSSALVEYFAELGAVNAHIQTRQSRDGQGHLVEVFKGNEIGRPSDTKNQFRKLARRQRV